MLAPVLPALRLLGASASSKGAVTTITTPGDQALKITTGSKTVNIDGRKVQLPVAPREVEGELYLPVRAVSAWLNADARFDADSRTLTISPLVTASYEMRAEGPAILVHSAAPLQYASGSLANPPRAYFDFRHVSLGLAEQQIPVDQGLVDRMRLAQNSVNPDIVRMTLDLKQPAVATATVSDQGRLVTILLTEASAVPAPPQAPIPAVPLAPAAPAKLLGLTLTPQPEQQTELTLFADNPLQVDGDYDSGKRQLTLHLGNALNTVPQDHLRVKDDKVIAKLETAGSKTDPGTDLVITLKDDYGYLIKRESAGIRVLMGVFNINDMFIVLDPGHGGGDSGAPGKRGTLEKNINLAVVLRAAKLLTSAGAKVLLTRSDDSFPTLKERPALANAKGADIFVSVHCNSSPTFNSGTGSQTYYTRPDSAALAAAMHTELIKGLELRDGGIHVRSLAVTRETRMPAVLLELAYINNEREETLLNAPDFQQKAAEAIVAGIRRYAATKAWQLRRSGLPGTDGVSADAGNDTGIDIPATANSGDSSVNSDAPSAVKVAAR